MASEYKINLKRFNGTDYDTIYPASKADIIKYNDGTTLEDNRVKSVIFNVPANAWTGDAEPFTCTVNINGITAKTNGIIGVPMAATEEQYAEAEECGLRITGQANGSITLAARFKKPTMELPFELIIIGINK